MSAKTTTKPASPGARRTAAPYRPTSGPRSGKPLTNKQKASLAQTARLAWDVQTRAGLTEGAFEDWRHEQQKEACGIASLRDCGNNHYRPILAHFLILAGREGSAFTKIMSTGPVRHHGDQEDTHEAREALRTKILDEIMHHGHRCDPQHPDYHMPTSALVQANGGLITAAYVTKIAQAKCRGRHLSSLTAGQLAQVLYTTRNRIAAREGRGDSTNRNKSQRKTTTP